VTDPDGLSGTSVASFVGPIISKVGATVVVASDLVGACPELKADEGNVLASDEFLQKAANATQYDWAFFFLYSKGLKPEEGTVSNDKAAVLHADATIRLADDQFFYVYSRDQNLMSDLQRMYPKAEYKASKFEDLDIPY
jgi:hypothetical protein